MFLKLTSATTNEEVRININNISSYTSKLDRSENKDADSVVGAYILVENTTCIVVKEKPEEIDKLLSSSYVMIKGAYENRTSEVPQHTTNSTINDREQLE